MNSSTLIPIALLLLLVIALASGMAIVLFAVFWQRRQRRALPLNDQDSSFLDVALSNPAAWHRPVAWVAVRSRNIEAVQTAVGLSNPTPCTCAEGFSADYKLFIAPPVNGWILITGSRLPDPSEDVDDCFRFLLNLSRRLGQVQYFNANSVLGNHAWARVEAGRVVRAYAWAGMTLWNQGTKTPAELGLGMKCFHYFEEPESERSEIITSNIEKVSLLAARWSIDPASIDERTFDHACGIAGEPARLY